MLVHNLWISLKITPCSYKLSFSRNKVILFENLFKPRQRPSATSKHCFELTSPVLSTTSKQCFEQPAANFLVCSLIFIEYEFSDCQFSLDKGRVGRDAVLPILHT